MDALIIKISELNVLIVKAGVTVAIMDLSGLTTVQRRW